MDFAELAKVLGVGGNALTVILAVVAYNFNRERKLIDSRIDDLKAWTRSIQVKIDESWTKSEQSEYRSEMEKRLDRIEGKIDRLLEK